MRLPRLQRSLKNVLDAKTDPIDAKVIVRFGEVIQPVPQVAQSDKQIKLGAFVERRRQILDLINQEQNRSQQTRDKDVRDSIDTVLKALKNQLKTLDKQIADAVKADDTNTRKEHTRPNQPTVAGSCNCTNENGALMMLSPERRSSVIDVPKQQAIPRAVASPQSCVPFRLVPK